MPKVASTHERAPADDIQALTAIATGTADVHVEHFQGTKLPALLWVFFGRKRIEGIPVSVFVMQHREGLLLFDTGVHPGLTSNPHYWPDRVTRLFMNNIFRFHVGGEDTLERRLELAGYHASSVRWAVLSHLHFDHAGGIGYIPQAQLLVSPDAWAHMLGPHPEREGVLRRDLDVEGAHWKRVEFSPCAGGDFAPFSLAHDVAGDGSMILLPTPGHLPGSISMLLRADPPILFVGDLCYSADLLRRNQLPGTGDATVLEDTWAKVRQLEERMPGLLIVPSHDKGALAELAQHPLYTDTGPTSAPDAVGGIK